MGETPTLPETRESLLLLGGLDFPWFQRQGH